MSALEHRPAEILALVPARGGSKGVPRKNVRDLAGRPLLQWSVDAARASKQVGRIVVSTDDPAIADVARSGGAEVPFLRPAELARDETPGADPVIHAIEWLAKNESYRPDLVLLLQPTSPLRTTADIDGAIHLALDSGSDPVVSVTVPAQHPYWMKRVDEAGHLHDLITQATPTARRQDLPECYAVNGAIYLIAPDLLIERRTWFTGRTRGYVMPPERSIDIDTEWDFRMAAAVLAAMAS
jgi:CMP-N,N'-diacetyllegionaminic acid synthase